MDTHSESSPLNNAVCLSSLQNIEKIHRKVEKEAAEDCDFTLRPSDRVPGLFLIDDFLSLSEEEELLRHIDNDKGTPWKHSSFNGHCDSKVYGVRTQFGLPHEPRLVRENDVSQGEFPIPCFLSPFVKRFQRIIASSKMSLPNELREFSPNDCNANRYYRHKGHHLKPHFDDRALSGPLLVNLSLAGTAIMTYSKPGSGVEERVELPRGCLQIITGPARWVFMHAIKAEDVLSERRVSITWRHSANRQTGVQPRRREKSIATSLLQLGDGVAKDG